MKRSCRVIAALLALLMLVGMMTTALAVSSAGTMDFVYTQSAESVKASEGGDITFTISFPKNKPFTSTSVGLDLTNLKDTGVTIKSVTDGLIPDWTYFTNNPKGDTWKPSRMAVNGIEADTFSEDQPIMQVTLTIPVGMALGTYDIYALTDLDAYASTDIYDPTSYTVQSKGQKVFSFSVTGDNSEVYYKVSYDANGGSVTPEYVNVLSGNSTKLPTPTRKYYTFNYWENGSHVNVGAAGANYTPTANVTLYANWTETPQREAPKVTAQHASTADAKDGKLLGTDNTMEYSLDMQNWTPCTGSQVSGLAVGKYYVRYRETDTEKPSKVAVVDVLYGTGTGTVVTVTLNKHELDLYEGKTETLVATVLPANTPNKSVTWTSSDKKVAKVDANGKVTAVSEGAAAITVTTVEGNAKDFCIVTVIGPGSGSGSGSGGSGDDTTPGYEDCPRDYTCPIDPYTDTNNDGWYHDGIHFCLDEGYMVGKTATHFVPNADTNRGQMVTILWRMSGEKKVNYKENFSDVDEHTWCYDAVCWAASLGIVEGYSDGTYRISQPITRQQLAAMMYRYAKLQGKGFKGAWAFQVDYTDRDQIGDYAYEAVCWCTTNGILNGYSDGTLKPRANASRAHVAAMVQRFSKLLHN